MTGFSTRPFSLFVTVMWFGKFAANADQPTNFRSWMSKLNHVGNAGHGRLIVWLQPFHSCRNQLEDDGDLVRRSPLAEA
jgi:DNA-binding transcriptional regulator of glucitol operon